MALTGLLPAISKMLGHILETTLQPADLSEDFHATPANRSVILGLCLEAVASPKKIVWPEQLKPKSLLVDISGRWGWSENVMGGLESLVKAR